MLGPVGERDATGDDQDPQHRVGGAGPGEGASVGGPVDADQASGDHAQDRAHDGPEDLEPDVVAERGHVPQEDPSGDGNHRCGEQQSRTGEPTGAEVAGQDVHEKPEVEGVLGGRHDHGPFCRGGRGVASLEPEM